MWQWVHEHIVERVSGISATNRFTDVVAMPLSALMHTEYVDNFVGLSQQESATRDAADRVSESIWRGRLSECLAGGFGASVLPCFMSTSEVDESALTGESG